MWPVDITHQQCKVLCSWRRARQPHHPRGWPRVRTRWPLNTWPFHTWPHQRPCSGRRYQLQQGVHTELLSDVCLKCDVCLKFSLDIFQFVWSTANSPGIDQHHRNVSTCPIDVISQRCNCNSDIGALTDQVYLAMWAVWHAEMWTSISEVLKAHTNPVLVCSHLYHVHRYNSTNT